MAAMSTGTSFSETFAVTTGAGPPSPPRPRPPRPPRPPPPVFGVSADVPLVHAPAATVAARYKERIRNRFDTESAPEDTRSTTTYPAFGVRIYAPYVI